LIPNFYLALYDSIAAHSRLGLNVVTDVGHHDAYQSPLHILPRCARRLEGLPVLFVGVRCSIEAIMERRNAGEPGREGVYVRGSADVDVPDPVAAWQREVHSPGIYDLEVDTSEQSPEACAALILAKLREGGGAEAFEKLARLTPPDAG
jgi:chloramphenicol 3-O phosphotransferase